MRFNAYQKFVEINKAFFVFVDCFFNRNNMNTLWKRCVEQENNK